MLLACRYKADDRDVCTHVNMPGGNPMAPHMDFEAKSPKMSEDCKTIPRDGENRQQLHKIDDFETQLHVMILVLVVTSD